MEHIDRNDGTALRVDVWTHKQFNVKTGDLYKKKNGHAKPHSFYKRFVL